MSSVTQFCLEMLVCAALIFVLFCAFKLVSCLLSKCSAVQRDLDLEIELEEVILTARWQDGASRDTDNYSKIFSNSANQFINISCLFNMNSNENNFYNHIFTDMISQNLSACLIGFGSVVLIGILLKCIACIQRGPRGTEGQDQDVPEHGYPWPLVYAGNFMYYFCIKMPCSLFCKHSNETNV